MKTKADVVFETLTDEWQTGEEIAKKCGYPVDIVGASLWDDYYIKTEIRFDIPGNTWLYKKRTGVRAA